MESGALGFHIILEGHKPSSKVVFPKDLSVYPRSSPFWKEK